MAILRVEIQKTTYMDSRLEITTRRTITNDGSMDELHAKPYRVPSV